MNKFTKESPIGIIANPISLENRDDLANFLGQPKNGFFSSMHFNFKDLRGEVVPLDIQPNSVLDKTGFELARKAMFNAVEYLDGQGAKVICFTASTKRLPGKLGQEIKKMYPNVIFTIGDNSTMVSFAAQLVYLSRGMDRNEIVVCLGAGFLGIKAVKTLLKQGFKNIFLLSEQKIDCFPPCVKVIDSLDKLPNNIKLLAGCSHKYQLNPESFAKLFAKSAVIVDVCVPAVVNREVYEALPSDVSRFDAGDFFLADVDYGFPPRLLNFPTKHHFYGCFTEAIMLRLGLQDGNNLKDFNFFEINSKNELFFDGYLRKIKAKIPLINFFNPIDQGVIPF